MIHNLAKRVADVFVRYGESSEENADIYAYIWEAIIATIINIGISLIVSTILGSPLRGIAFVIAFAFMRRYCGGYHASTHMKCIISFNCIMICAIVVVNLLVAYQLSAISFIIAVLGFAGIYILSPFEGDNKSTSMENVLVKKQKSRRYAFILLLKTGLGNIILSWDISFSVSIAMFAVACSLIAAQLRSVYQEKKNNQLSKLHSSNQF